MLSAYSGLIGNDISEGEIMNKNNVITKDYNNKEIFIKSGDTFQIELESSGATGYIWQIEKMDSEYLILLSEGTKDFSTKKLGAPTVRYWQIKALKKGNTEIQMLYFRPWEGIEKSIEKFRLKVNIK